MTDTGTQDRELVTVAEANEMLPVSKSTIREMFHDGTLPALDFGGGSGRKGGTMRTPETRRQTARCATDAQQSEAVRRDGSGEW